MHVTQVQNSWLDPVDVLMLCSLFCFVFPISEPWTVTIYLLWLLKIHYARAKSFPVILKDQSCKSLCWTMNICTKLCIFTRQTCWNLFRPTVDWRQPSWEACWWACRFWRQWSVFQTTFRCEFCLFRLILCLPERTSSPVHVFLVGHLSAYSLSIIYFSVVFLSKFYYINM